MGVERGPIIMAKTAQRYRVKSFSPNGHATLGDEMTREIFDGFVRSMRNQQDRILAAHKYTFVPVDEQGNEIVEQVPGMIELQERLANGTLFVKCDRLQRDCDDDLVMHKIDMGFFNV